MEHLDMRVHEIRLSSAALIKFCDLHGVKEPGIDSVRPCHRMLEAGEISTAIIAFRQVPLGGNGCFNDWQPDDIAHSDFDYVLATFRALVERWARLMQLLDAPNNSFKPKPLRGSA
jgi:hypothetical protein